MTVLKVLIYPDARLRLQAKPVVVFDAALKQIIEDMKDTLYHFDAAGLAATQVDIQQRVFLMDASRDRSELMIFINPEIIQKDGTMSWQEGCLSFPGVYIPLDHAKTVTVRYQDVTGAFQESTFSNDVRSVCVQHETDHLDGRLMIDALSRLKRERALKKMEKELRASESHRDNL